MNGARRRPVAARCAAPDARGLLVAAGASLALAGCGSQAPVAAPAPPRAGAVPARPAGHAVGATLRIRARGATLAVTVLRMIDPLRGSGAALLPRTRAVGVLVRIRNRGPGAYDSSSTGDIGIVPSAGAALAVSASRGRCMTTDRDFDNQISPGETRSGCVVFAVDRGARVVSVRFAADGGGAGVGRWRLRARSGR